MGQEGGPVRPAGVPDSQPAPRVQQERHRADGERLQAEQAGDVRDEESGGAAERHQVQVNVSQVTAEIAFQIPRQNLLWWM